ncbi:hypothetical protein [Litoreibacter janthinus]|uniref:Pyruvate carboxyltransferase domain-containing protein n=1 Tax=Litoreibacter janthinus TaxID=670154 RepID=A0A1I6H8Q7_9RHOB|nr:hypothetical protein [Litoreibacter janthinus]SFR50704.1 hypothetical protein SAMN04488002_2666 [Litoreibacter janthinus]
MKLKRLTVKLPASMAATASHDARAIAEAVGQALAKGAQPNGPIAIHSHGQRGTVLASQVTAGLKGGRHGR